MAKFKATSSCPKCGARKASSEYREAGHACGRDYPEYIRRVCGRCGFVRAEHTLDSAQVKVQE